MARLFMEGWHRFPNIFDYGSIYLNNNAKICLNIADCPWLGQKMPEWTVLTRSAPESFQDRWNFVELGHFNKLSVKNARKKKGPTGKYFGAFSSRSS